MEFSIIEKPQIVNAGLLLRSKRHTRLPVTFSYSLARTNKFLRLLSTLRLEKKITQSANSFPFISAFVQEKIEMAVLQIECQVLFRIERLFSYASVYVITKSGLFQTKNGGCYSAIILKDFLLLHLPPKKCLSSYWAVAGEYIYQNKRECSCYFITMSSSFLLNAKLTTT